MLIEALRPLLVRLPETDLKLVPGVPVEFARRTSPPSPGEGA